MPIILFSVILFAVWLSYRLKKSTGSETENAAFLKREQEANFTRRIDPDTVEYMKIRTEALPFSKELLPEALSAGKEAELLDCKEKILLLSKKRMLNLSGLTNTDIKLQYGAANLPLMMQYDENFTKLSRLLTKWGRLLYEAGETVSAEQVLSYTVSLGVDIEEVFLLLARIYKSDGNSEKLKELEASVSHFDDLRRENVLKRIKSI